VHLLRDASNLLSCRTACCALQYDPAVRFIGNVHAGCIDKMTAFRRSIWIRKQRSRFLFSILAAKIFAAVIAQSLTVLRGNS